MIKEDKETVEAPEEEGFLVDDKKEITDEDLENITEEPLSLDKQIEDLQEKVLRALKTFSCSCLLYTSPSPRDATLSRMPSSA